MAHGNPPSLSLILLLSSLSHPPLSTLINCFFFLLLCSFSSCSLALIKDSKYESRFFLPRKNKTKRGAAKGAMGEVQIPAEDAEQWLK